MTEPRNCFATEDWVPYPVEQVFAFFAQPRNLPRLMPAWQKTRIEALTLMPTPPNPTGRAVSGAAGAGSRITISFRPFPFSPLRLRWLARIQAFAWNDHFCDVEVTGPFAYWRHCHRVRAEERNGQTGTRIIDEVGYALPLGPLDELANDVFMRAQMEAIFAYRKKTVHELLAAESSAPPART